MSKQQRFRTNRDSSVGFVNVELLVVLTILGVLAGLVLLVVMTFVTHADRKRDAQWYLEVIKLHAGMESFKEKFDELPPNFDDKQRVEAFVAKAFPQYKPGVSAPYPDDLDAAEALVFWLSGISTDPADPFAGGERDRFTFFQFPAERMRDGRFYPPGDKDVPPYVYFVYTSYGTEEYEGFRPYVRSQDGRHKEHFAPESMQIIAAGRDGKLGHGGLITKLGEEDRDNIVNFTTQRIGDIELGD